MITVYFDTNIYDQIYKRDGVSDEDVEKLRSLVESGQIRIVVSFTVLDEIASSVISDGHGATDRLKLVYELADKLSIVRDNSDLSYVQEYANGQRISPSIVAPPPDFKHWLTNPGLPFLQRVAKGVQADVQAGFTGIRPIFDKYDSVVVLEGASDSAPSFDQFWTDWAPLAAERLAERAGFGDECRGRGIDGFLNLRNVRLSTLCELSTYYEVLFERSKYKRGDGYDVKHALDSGAAQIFVTNDRKLRNRMSRKAIDDYRVVSFREFINIFS